MVKVYNDEKIVTIPDHIDLNPYGLGILISRLDEGNFIELFRAFGNGIINTEDGFKLRCRALAKEIPIYERDWLISLLNCMIKELKSNGSNSD